MADKEIISKPVESEPKGGFTKKRAVIAMVVVLVVAAVGGGYYLWIKQKEKVALKTCVEEPVAIITASGFNYQKLQPQIDKIKAHKEYEKDANCLGVITFYYVGLSDTTNAREYLNKLKSVYPAEGGYSPKLDPYVSNPDEFTPAVDFIEKQREQVKKNSFLGPAVPAE